jgi:TolB-like protein
MNRIVSARAFGAELRRRKVWRTAAAYASVALVIALAVAELYDVLLLPDWTPRLVILLLAAGLPIALALSWSYELKPEERPAAVPLVVPPGREVVTSAEAAYDIAEQPGVVVLPFDNLSPDPAEAYFSDGLTEEIIATLSTVRGLRVISRNSAMALKATQKDTRTIGRELGVRYVLEGSVRKAGDALRITAQLIDAATDGHIWSRRFDGTLAEIFDVQDSVARSLAEALRLELPAASAGGSAASRIPDARAYEAYLRAKQLVWDFSPSSLARARRELLNGLEIIGPNPLFHAGLAQVDWALYDSGAEHEAAVLDRGEAHAAKALELDPSLPEAWLGRGLIRYKRGDMGGYLRDGLRAVELGGAGEMSCGLAFTLAEVGLMDLARAYSRSGLARDPLFILPHLFQASVEFLDGRRDDALRRIRDARQRFAPDDALGGWWHAQMAAHAGALEEARSVASAVIEFDQVPLMSAFCRLLLCSLDGDRAGVLAVLNETSLRDAATTDEYYPIFLADTLAPVGEHAEALRWIESAVGWGFTNHVYLEHHDRFVEPLRAAPRFRVLMDAARRKQAEIAAGLAGARIPSDPTRASPTPQERAEIAETALRSPRKGGSRD